MSGLRVLARRLLATLQSWRMDRELRSEIESHLAEAADDYVRRGMTPAEARAAARRAFGGVSQVEEVHRDVRALTWVSDLHQDVRHTWRSFARTPGFVVVAALTLALGIGATTTIFTLLDAVIFKPLPVPAADELVTFYENGPEGAADPAGGTGRFLRFSYPRFERLQQALGPAGSIAAVTRSAQLIVRRPGDGERSYLNAQFVSGGFFDTLGVGAARGRVVTADDARLERLSPIAVVSDGFWRRFLGGAETALGQTIVINNVSLTVVGITPPGFVGLWTDREADVWLPVTLQQPLHYYNNSSSYSAIDDARPWMLQSVGWLNLVARIPGGDVRRVLPALEAANRDGVRELADLIRDARDHAAMLSHTLAVEPLSRGFSGLRARFSDALFILGGLVVLVLLVTCANIANLLLARAAVQARDVAIRISLGARTSRLVRQCLTESLALAAVGGAIGVWLSGWASGFLARQVLGGSGRLPLVFAADSRVLVFAAGTSSLAAIVFGLAPAFRAIRAGRRASLTAGNQRLPLGQSTVGMRSLVVAQLALSVVLVFAALLLGRTLVNFMRIDPGFAPDRLMTVLFDPMSSGYTADQLPALAHRLVGAASAVPGVSSAAASACGIVAGCSSSGSFRIEGAGDDLKRLYRNWVSPGYFQTAGIRVVAGREFTERDTAGAPSVAVVNETAARLYFAGRAVLGTHVGSGMEVVGVVRDVRTQSLHDDPVPMLYIPIDQQAELRQRYLTNLDVRVAGAPAAVEQAVRAAIRGSEPNLLIGDMGLMSRRIARDLTREWLVADLAFAFGGLTLLLAALGLYGVLSYGVAQRTREIGVRMALGAERAQVLTMIGFQGVRLTLAGLALGFVAAYAGSRYLTGMLFGVKPLDPLTFVLVVLAFVVVAALASYLPARRAMRVDPLVALRCE